MVTERIFATRITDVDTMIKAGVDMKKLAHLGVHIFFTQVFDFKFFHADMHPGNLFIDHTDANNPKFVAVDFGIVGSIDDENSNYLAQNLLAFFTQDYRKVAQLHIDSQWVNPKTKVYELEAAIRAVCEPIFSKPLKEISFGLVLMQLFQVARRFEMEVQPQLVLLQKTLINIESLGKTLYPDLNLWESAKPFFEKWAKKRYYPQNVAKITAAHLNEIPKTLKAIQKLADNKPPASSHHLAIIVIVAQLVLILLLLK
jgi:ubiquinone biosynthesis protein